MYIWWKFRWVWCFVWFSILILILLFDIGAHLFEIDYSNFVYPREMTNFDDKTIKLGRSILDYEFVNINHAANTVRCAKPHFTFIIKSAMTNFQQRTAIRKTWGDQRNKHNNNTICTVFMIGNSDDNRIHQQVQDEAAKYNDIVQANFIDSYYNNTIKTLTGMRWVVEFCKDDCKYVMFVDDDYYVSVKNVLKFIKQHSTLDELYAGYVLQTKPHRHMFSKWRTGLQEYPFRMWPPYITAGSFLLSHRALYKLYCYSLNMQLFRFDDVFLGIAALNSNVTLIHSSKFHFDRPIYDGPDSYRDVITSHGFNNPRELEIVWNEMVIFRV